MFSVSVSLALPGWSLDDVLAGPIASRSTIALSTAGALRTAGYELLPTYDPPHYDLVLPGPGYDDAVLLLSYFSDPQPNPHKRRGR